jgi:hypothetical protein
MNLLMLFTKIASVSSEDHTHIKHTLLENWTLLDVPVGANTVI